MDVKLVFNRPLCHCILLREFEDEWEDIISFELQGKKVSFGRKDFDIIIGLGIGRDVLNLNRIMPLDCDNYIFG